MVDPSRINWSPKPPKPRIQVYSVPPGQTVRVIAAGPVRGVLTHWSEERKESLPCDCPDDRHEPWQGQVPVWRGYMPAYWTNGRRVIMEVTLGAVQNLPELLQRELTGLWIKFRRTEGKKTGAVYCEILEELRRGVNTIPYDPTDRLLEMWGLKPPADQVEEGGAS